MGSKFTGDGRFPDCIPITLGVSFDGLDSKFKSSVGNGGVVFPDVVVCGSTSGEFSMNSLAKSLGDGCQSYVSQESDDELPMEVSSSSAKLHLPFDPNAPFRKVGEELMLFNSEKPVSTSLAALRCRAWHRGHWQKDMKTRLGFRKYYLQSGNPPHSLSIYTFCLRNAWPGVGFK